MTDPFATVASELPRDRWGRPLITPPEGGEPVAYQRVTTFVGALEDTYHLSEWGKRMVAIGMARRPDLQAAASAISDPKDRYQKRTLNDIAKQALEAANGSAAATLGTALHSLTELIDQGQEPTHVPEQFQADLDAYKQVTAGFAFLDAEGFCVVDDLRVGGSYDRIVDFGEELAAPDGTRVRTCIWDLKTGGSTDGGLFGIGKIAMQLGVYANAVKYDHTLGSRSALPGRPSTAWGVVCHLPAGSGSAQLLWVDIAAGWEVARTLAPGVHAWRKRRDLSQSFRTATGGTPAQASIPALIQTAASYADLQAIHAANRMVWTPGLTALAKARRAELEATA
jgi:hypothetical protein